MVQDRILWEDIPDTLIEKWVSDYKLDKWPFGSEDKHDLNRDKVERLYSEILKGGNSGKLPKDKDLANLYDVLSKVRCAVFNDEKLIRYISQTTTSENRTCEFAVRDLNQFIESL